MFLDTSVYLRRSKRTRASGKGLYTLADSLACHSRDDGVFTAAAGAGLVLIVLHRKFYRVDMYHRHHHFQYKILLCQNFLVVVLPLSQCCCFVCCGAATVAVSGCLCLVLSPCGTAWWSENCCVWLLVTYSSALPGIE